MSEAAATQTASVEALLARLPDMPKAERTEAAMVDAVIDFAARLPQNSITLARLKAKLQGLGVKITIWTTAVRRRRTELEATSTPADERKTDKRPRIVVNLHEEFEVNEAAIKALAALPNLYQRYGALVHVIESEHLQPGEQIRETVREIREIKPHLLRELFTRAALWQEEQPDIETGGTKLVRTHPPEWSVRAVHEWGSWPGIKPLRHISEIPVLFADGSILSRPGYDRRSGILYQPRVVVPEISESPTEAEVKAATAKLLGLVDEFPFETEAHRSALFAALLTPIARWAFTGQSPMFMFDANQSGSGKGLLLHVIGLLVLGHHMDLITATSNEEEERKRITAKILSGAQMVVIDNIGTTFGSQVIEALLTTGVWSERLLGGNEAPRLDAWITWYGSGNNVHYAREDTRRRVCTIRILTNEERPEERSGYRIADLEGYVLEHRGELLAATLTLLRGWILAETKASTLPGWGGPWGSFNQWDQVVRGAILFAGLTDPIATKATKDATDAAASGLRELVEGIEEAVTQLDHRGVTAAQIIDAMTENDEWRRADRKISVRFKRLRDAFSKLFPKLPSGRLPNQYQLGNLLGRFRAKPCARKWILSRKLNGDNLWVVEAVPETSKVQQSAAVEQKAVVDTFGVPAITDGRCDVCGAYAHRACGRCSRCAPDAGGCLCKECLGGEAGSYVQHSPCNLCGETSCRCRRCGECQRIGLENGGCCC
ncbi:MAG: hypothetical protein IT372_30380 [Polyangiaceae bacterium]|nr:hypothetical protein [Polyangiaceae bacterium]